ncbi:hypothetical protein LRY65_02445 [Candidatus Woesebacteria bacterium]|nr:hypothetical protein [Candidatus Woesebacteria bacterium]MCD8507162.1 hypothetical protein [Candidatus Woesebacteria bacterium]MCD8527053.1 hypothetical protein [Candidatus Woesebacteria bacterium]MCD8545945.1 hypothetical protein [Candidatus Woesebacteria bacterium]
MQNHSSPEPVPTDTTKDSPLDDFCPICAAQEKADNEGRDITLDELMEAFRESEKLGAVVGYGPDDL